MIEIPTSWSWSTIGELTQYIQRGKSPKYVEHSELPVINQKCIRWNQLQLEHLKFIHPEQFAAWDEARYIEPGDILWNSTGTGTVGRAYLVTEKDCVPPKVVDSHVTIVRPAPGLDARYLYNWIKGPVVQSKIEEMCDGTTNQIELSRTAIAATRIPLAPVAEQTRIADQLDKLLARVRACNDRLDAIPALLKRFRQAVLAAATSGKLTDSDDLGATSGETTIGSIAVDLRYGTSKKCGYTSTGTGVLRIPNIADHGRIDIGDLKRAEFDSKEIEKLALREGDLLVIRSNGSVELVGKTSLVSTTEAGLLFAGYLMRLRVDQSRALPAFIQLCLSAPAQRSHIERTAKSTSGVNNLNAEELRALLLRLPSLAEQAEIVRRVDAFFKLADRIEACYKAACAQAQRLTPLLLAKAFRGELVPQDPNDEPVSELLARASARRPTSVKSSPRSRTAHRDS